MEFSVNEIVGTHKKVWRNVQEKAFPASRAIKRTRPRGKSGNGLRADSLPLDIVVHVHQVADGADIVGDVGIAVDGVLDGAACHSKVDHVHSLIVVQHGIDQAAGKGIAAAHAVQNIKGVELALKGVAVVPHKGLEAVFAAAVGIAHMAGNALEVGVAGNEMLEDLVDRKSTRLNSSHRT